MQFLGKRKILVGQYPYGDSERLGADISGHVENQRLKRHNERQLRHNRLKNTHHAGNGNAETEQDDEPGQALLHAVEKRLIEILLGGQTGQTGVIFAHFVIDDFNHALCRDDAEDPLRSHRRYWQ